MENWILAFTQADAAYVNVYQQILRYCMPLLVGLAMVIVGNWLPKCKQSYTMGIKLPWTLESEENWNRTHRFAGPVWVAGGLVIMACGVIGGVFMWAMLAAFVVMVIAPVVYSYLMFKRGNE